MPGSRRTNDPDGREVVLGLRTERHLKQRRPEMIRHISAILNAVERPDFREDDVVVGRERFFRRDLDPTRWLRVVVDFNQTPGLVVTAFVQYQKPRSSS